ncbi:MAG TPA: carboxypeptidase regulatory-like domain-containing protein [Parasegetibacter sp.]
MKRSILSSAAMIFAAAGFLAFTQLQTGIVTGTVTPPEQVEAVWAIKGTDTVKTTMVDGRFSLQVKQGSHTILIDAKDPYKDVVMENVEVGDGQNIDLGEIVLEQ